MEIHILTRECDEKEVPTMDETPKEGLELVMAEAKCYTLKHGHHITRQLADDIVKMKGYKWNVADTETKMKAVGLNFTEEGEGDRNYAVNRAWLKLFPNFMKVEADIVRFASTLSDFAFSMLLWEVKEGKLKIDWHKY